jgi:hypothetical protein
MKNKEEKKERDYLKNYILFGILLFKKVIDENEQPN